MITDSQRFKPVLLLALTASMFSLAAALFVQYGFDMKPCELCELQRIPYGVVILLAFAGLWRLRCLRLIITLIIIAFFAGAGLASYHAAIEKKWISGPVSCTGSAPAGQQSLEALLAKIHHAAIVACDQPAWQFHGITMAGLNAAWSLFLVLAVFVAMQHNRKFYAHA